MILEDFDIKTLLLIITLTILLIYIGFAAYNYLRTQYIAQIDLFVGIKIFLVLIVMAILLYAAAKGAENLQT